MATRFFTNKPIRNTRVVRPVSSRIFVFLAAVAVAGSVFSCFLMVGAQQHFQAVQLGYQSEDLRRQASELEERLRRLNLEYARVTSPVELEKRAKDAGMAFPKSTASQRSDQHVGRKPDSRTRIRADIGAPNSDGAAQ